MIRHPCCLTKHFVANHCAEQDSREFPPSLARKSSDFRQANRTLSFCNEKIVK